MKTLILLLVLAGLTPSRMFGEQPMPMPRTSDWRQILQLADKTPPDSLIRHLSEKLKQSKVPTAREAERKSWPLMPYANRSTQISGLFRLATPVKDIGEKGDFVWEVHVIEGEDLADVIWVGASTGNAKSVFPK